MFGKTPLESLIAVIASVFDAYSALLFLPDTSDPSARRRLHAFFSLSDHVDREATAVPGQNLPGIVLVNQEPILTTVEDAKRQLGYYDGAVEANIRTFMGCPVANEGVLCIDSKKNNAFTESQQKLLHLFALLISQLINDEKAPYSAQQVEEAHYFEAISKLETIQSQKGSWPVLLRETLAVLAEYGEFDHAFLATPAENNSGFTLEDEFPPSLLRETINAASFESKILENTFIKSEALFMDSIHRLSKEEMLHDEYEFFSLFNSFICIPMIVDGKCCALLCLVNVRVRRFSNEICRFVRIVAENLQNTLEKISLKYRLNSLRRR